MPSNITLKNRNNVDVVFVPRETSGNNLTYISAGASLLGRLKLDLALRENGNTNRIVGKLSIPTVGVNPQTGVAGVLWTEVGSCDLTAVKAASSDAADDFVAMWASLAASPALAALYKTGARL